MQSYLTDAIIDRQANKRCLPSAEDLERMTFQVVLLGSDGLVVASDRMVSYVTPGTPGVGHSVQRGLEGKFKKSDDGSLICFFAGGPDAQDIARRISTECLPTAPELQWESRLQRVAEDFPRPIQASLSDEILVVRRDTPSAVWLVVKSGDQRASVSKISDQRCLGDNSPARFLPGHLWSRTTIQELKTLAILTLSYAQQENPSAVSEEFDVMTLGMTGDIAWETQRAGNNLQRVFTESLKNIVKRLGSRT